jgi:hypothetical protein
MGGTRLYATLALDARRYGRSSPGPLRLYGHRQDATYGTARGPTEAGVHAWVARSRGVSRRGAGATRGARTVDPSCVAPSTDRGPCAVAVELPSDPTLDFALPTRNKSTDTLGAIAPAGPSSLLRSTRVLLKRRGTRRAPADLAPSKARCAASHPHGTMEPNRTPLPSPASVPCSSLYRTYSRSLMPH